MGSESGKYGTPTADQEVRDFAEMILLGAAHVARERQLDQVAVRAALLRLLREPRGEFELDPVQSDKLFELWAPILLDASADPSAAHRAFATIIDDKVPERTAALLSGFPYITAAGPEAFVDVAAKSEWSEDKKVGSVTVSVTAIFEDGAKVYQGAIRLEATQAEVVANAERLAVAVQNLADVCKWPGCK